MNSIDQIISTALPVEGGILLILFIAIFISSMFEKEERAAYLSLLLGIALSLPFLLPFLFNFSYPDWISLALVALPLIALLVLFFPFRGRIQYSMQNPTDRFDERDTMFSRRTLVPGSERFNEYYERQPGNKPLDNKFRKLPGLLKAGTQYYDPILFAAANSIFERVETDLHPRVEGTVAGAKAETAAPGEISKMLLKMAVDWGAVSAGITELHDYHVYSIGGRGDRYGKEFKVDHKYALAFTVEMDYDMMRAAPGAPTVLESANQYLQSGMIAVQLAEFIRAMGYPARAHIDGNYKVICPLIARDAGLGEIGRMGLLMTPKLGPRCRIAVVTTDLPLIPTPAKPQATTIDFCRRCEKCALVCPTQSIEYGPEKIHGGEISADIQANNPSGDQDSIKRWKIDDAGCFAYWCQAGTDCGRCMIVCPYAHPDNWFHRLIRFGIRNNILFRRLAVPMDDLFYGKKPSPRAIR
ncbi:4Fe-4S dicluster domain-containing protein [Bacteroidota bacterium]